MCGLIALFGVDASDQSGFRNALQHMHRRGPDGEGAWEGEGVLLGHRRLAILDLEARAAQPMQSACGRYVIVFNGEIYNFRELRRGLEAGGVPLRTTSDTEVLLRLFAHEGEAMLPKLHGMFAFVIWDKVSRRAFAARDPYGIKPLYIARIPGGVMMASQVKALLATGLVSREPDPKGHAGFWMLGSVPEPHTCFRDIQSLPPGQCAWVESGNVRSIRCWNDIGEAWREPGDETPQDVEAMVREAVRESVTRHLVSDVPVGVFLSGGIDSGALAGLMVEAGACDLLGVTISFEEFAGSHQDEAPVAARLAAHYGIRHHIRRVTRDEFQADLPRILQAMDQPTIDGVNTWYASKAVAELGLKVVVSGVGGDELFQGYQSFHQLPRLVRRWRGLSALPGIHWLGRKAGQWQAQRSGNARWRHAADWMQTIEGAWWLRRGLFAPDDVSELTAGMADGAKFDPTQSVHAMTGVLPRDPRLALGQIESMTYMRNQLLRDSDWASMDHSVELRTPLVDAHLLQQLQPLLGNFSRFPNKRLLANAPAKPLPESIIQRKKTGFGIPVARWLADAGIAANDGSRGWAVEVAREM
jgi:asparagine synthase (glutamine-hydrolysing)